MEHMQIYLTLAISDQIISIKYAHYKDDNDKNNQLLYSNVAARIKILLITNLPLLRKQKKIMKVTNLVTILI